MVRWKRTLSDLWQIDFKNPFSECAETVQFSFGVHFLPAVRFEPGTAGWEAQTLLLCHGGGAPIDLISLLNFPVPRFPGDREDNLWLCYDADKVPRNEQEWRDKNFVHKTHFGYYSWPAEMKVVSITYSTSILSRSTFSLLHVVVPWNSKQK